MKVPSAKISAYDKVLEAMEGGHLPAGTHLLEDKLAREFKLSRVPVREALKRLQGQGLVEHQPGGGMAVVQIQGSESYHLFAAREALEGATARLAAASATEDEIGALQAIVDADEEQFQRRRPVPAVRHFHRHLASIAHNRFLAKALDTLRLSVSLIYAPAPDERRRGDVLREHQAIVTAIRNRDGDAAEQAARSHIQSNFRDFTLRL